MGETLDPEISRLLEETEEDVKPIQNGRSHFQEDQFFQKVLEGGNEYTEKLVEHLDKALNAPIKEDRSLFKQRLIATYWNFIPGILKQITDPNIPKEKILCIRYGMVDINLLRPEQREIFKQIPMEKGGDKWPFYYVDEWLKNIASGKIKASMIDEVAQKKTDDQDAIRDKLANKQDSRNAEINILKKRASDREMIEKSLQGAINGLLHHNTLSEYSGAPDAYTKEQKSIMAQIVEDLRKLKYIDDMMNTSLRELRNIDSQIQELQSKMGTGGHSIDSSIVLGEFNSLRQMIKMCIGPRGNHFPILISDYCPGHLSYIATRENVIKEVEEIERRDASVFVRRFKNQDNRIVPYIILVPAYGDSGVCWEPFDMRQRATSRGRIAIPLYPRSVKIALLSALGDLRWQVAKEYAGYRWMEEGLTGKYYDYFNENKIKGNIKDEFVADYITWITEEWEGRQKLHPDARMIFWRYVPFPQSKKDELKNRGYYYADLYKRDQRRAMSDGY